MTKSVTRNNEGPSIIIEGSIHQEPNNRDPKYM